MSGSWSSDDDFIEGSDGNDNDIVDVLWAGYWPMGPQRFYSLKAAIGATIGYMALCQVLAKRFSTETDERIVTTAKVVRRSEVVSRNTWIALRCWETGALNNLHAAVEACILACEELYGNLSEYVSEMYPVDYDGTISPDTLFDMAQTYEASLVCRNALEKFLVVWYEEKVPE